MQGPYENPQRSQRVGRECVEGHTYSCSEVLHASSAPGVAVRSLQVITTYGDLDCKFPVTHCDDIGRVTMRAALDPRCVNKVCGAACVALVSQRHPSYLGTNKAS